MELKNRISFPCLFLRIKKSDILSQKGTYAVISLTWNLNFLRFKFLSSQASSRCCQL
jgi:hypothetical protein